MLAGGPPRLPCLSRRARILQEVTATAFMGTGALLLFYQGRFMEGGDPALWYPQAGMLVGELLTHGTSCPAAQRLPARPARWQCVAQRSRAACGASCGSPRWRCGVEPSCRRAPDPAACRSCQTASLLQLSRCPLRTLPALPCFPLHVTLHPRCPHSGLLNGLCVLALGGGTGPAMNPGRDLGPRIAFQLLPIRGK